MECGNMSEEDYKASLEVEYAEEQAYEFQLRRDGIVAFLDILGYKHLAETGSEDVIREVMDVLRQAQNETAKLMPELDLPPDVRSQLVMEVIDDVKLINISDSIILHNRFPLVIPFGPEVTKRKRLCDAFVVYRFVTLCQHVWSVLFERGLPLRGAISVGTFYWNHETIMAGKPFVEAYNDSESLSFSGLVLTQDTLSAIHERAGILFEEDSPFHLTTQEMPVPMKTKSGDRLCSRNVIFPDLPDVPIKKVADYARKRFEAHGKKVDSPRVQAILKNTIEIVTSLKCETTNMVSRAELPRSIVDLPVRRPMDVRVVE